MLSEQKMQITEYAAVFNSVEDKIDLYKLCCNLYLLVWPNFMKKIACRNYCRFGVLRDVTVWGSCAGTLAVSSAVEGWLRANLVGGWNYGFNMFNTINCSCYLLSVLQGQTVILTGSCNSRDLLCILTLKPGSKMIGLPSPWKSCHCKAGPILPEARRSLFLLCLTVHGHLYGWSLI